MPPGHYFVIVCLFGTAFSRKSQDALQNEFARSNTQYRETNIHDPVRYPDTIDIDNNQGRPLEGRSLEYGSSGGGQRDEEWGSGNWPDDEDWSEEEYSGFDEIGPPAVQPPIKRPGAGTGVDDKNKYEDTNKAVDEQPEPDSETDDSFIYDPTNSGPADKDIEFKNGPEGEDNDDSETDGQPETDDLHTSSIIGTPGLLPGIIGGAVVGLLCAVLLVMFIVYRMRKKDEGSYALEEPKMTSPSRGYTRAPTKEYWA